MNDIRFDFSGPGELDFTPSDPADDTGTASDFSSAFDAEALPVFDPAASLAPFVPDEPFDDTARFQEHLLSDDARFVPFKPPINGSDGAPMTPVTESENMRTFSDGAVTIGELDTANVRAAHHTSTFVVPPPAGMSADRAKERGLGSTTVVKESFDSVKEDIGDPAAMISGSGFYNLTPGNALNFAGNVGPIENAFPEPYVQDGQIVPSSYADEGVGLADSAGVPAVLVTRDGEIEVLSRTDEAFAVDANGDTVLDANGEPKLQDRVGSLVPGMSTDFDDLPPDQRDNGANVVVQVVDDGLNGATGTEHKTYIVHTSNVAPEGRGVTLEEPLAVDEIIDRLGLPKNAALDINSVALDPSSSGELPVKGEGDSRLVDVVDRDHFPEHPLLAPSQGRLPFVDDRINNPRYFEFTERTDD